MIARLKLCPLVCLAMVLTQNLWAQTHQAERLFCGQCGTEASLLDVFCGECGERLDKEALLARLQHRVALAEEAQDSITMTPAEVRVMVEAGSRQNPGPAARRSRSDVERVLSIVAPAAIGLGAFFMASTVAHSIFK